MKIPVLEVDCLTVSYWLMRPQRPHKPQTISSIAGHRPELDGKTLLLKTSHCDFWTWDDQAGSSLPLGWLLWCWNTACKPSFWGEHSLSVILQCGCCVICTDMSGEIGLQVRQSHNHYECNQLFSDWVLRPTSHEGAHAQHCEPEEATASVGLNGCDDMPVNLPFQHLCL